jgi:hypothetical protein
MGAWLCCHRLSSSPSRLFSPLTALRELSLAHNSLTRLHPAAFSALSGLMRLYELNLKQLSDK